MLTGTERQTQLTLIGGVAILYIAGRAAASAIASDAAAPVARAFAYWLPIAAVAMLAVFLDQPLLATSIIFATSVASLALVGGSVAVIGMSDNEPAAWPVQTRKIAGLLLPVTVLALLAGFAGHFTWFSSVILAIQGATLLFVWHEPAADSGGPKWFAHLQKKNLLLAAILCPAGAWAVVRGTIGLTHIRGFPPPNIVATTALSPLLSAPILMGGAALAQRGQAWAAAATQAAIAQLNLCVLLPLVAIAWQLRWHAHLEYPMANWRVDAVMLVLLAAAMIPASTGHWRLGRLEGGVLIALYCAYVLATIAVSMPS